MICVKVTDKAQCAGCCACGDICPASAISFSGDKGGFLYPKVDESKCVNCGKCDAVCPVLHIEETRKNADARKPNVFALIANNLALRFDSTSGGAFSIFAEHIFRKGGFVGGAIWGDGWNVLHVLTDDKQVLPKLRSSKYAQSDARGFYVKVKTALETGRPVMVVGLPCQMFAMRTFLGRSYDNLYVFDLICRSVGSPFYFKQYVKMHEVERGARVVAIKQKDKGLGWRKLTTKLKFDNGDVIYDPKLDSLFMRAFEANLISRPSCYECRFRGFPRCADITLADCWLRKGKLPEDMDHDLGTSLVMCNTDKGRLLFEEVSKTSDVTIHPVALDDVIQGNPGLVRSIPKGRVDSDVIYDGLLKNEMRPYMTSMLSSIMPVVPLKRRIINYLKRVFGFRYRLLKLARVNGWANILKGKPLLLTSGRTLLQIDQGAELQVKKDFYLGGSLIQKSRVESRVRLFSGARWEVNGGSIASGCYIILFKNAMFSIGKDCSINIGFTVSCGEKIQIGNNVYIGQNVSIRDTNGDHYLNTPGYQAHKPVIIEDHVWIASKATIMPGVRIGAGSVVAGNSLVNKDVPPGTLVAGIPAKVIRENIQFRC